MKSIIFNQHQVNHALKNKEGMFRVVVKPQPLAPIKPFKDLGFWTNEFEIDEWISKFQVGETIFVKEVWSFSDSPWNDKTIFYRASNSDFIQHTFSVSRREKKWRSPVTLHKEYSRLTPRIKNVKVERLQDISEEDCWKEGLDTSSDYADYAVRQSVKEGKSEVGARDYFREKWNSTHKKPEEKWEANPWVWCFNYEVVKNN